MPISVIIRKIINKIRYRFFYLPKERIWRAYVLKKTKSKPVILIDSYSSDK